MKIVSLLASTFLTIAATSKIVGFDRYIVTDVYGAFDGTTDPTILVKANGYGTKDKLFVSYYYLDSGAKYCGENYDLILNSKDEPPTQTKANVTLKLKGRMTNGVKITFELGNTKTKYSVATIKLYPKKEININANKYKNSPYISENYIFQILGKNNVVAKEKILFNGIPDIITNSKYNYIDLNDAYFTYDNDFELSSIGECYLSIANFGNLFPYISKFKKTISIPLKITEDGKRYNISYKNIMYVNPYTLEMSLVERDGFIETDKFYLPIGKEEMLENNVKMYFYFSDLGRSGVNARYDISYLKDYNFFGECDDSVYCVGGGIRKW